MFAEEGEVNAERATAVGATGPSEAEDPALTKAATRAGRRRVAAQTSLFDLANQKVVDELREADPETMSEEDTKELLRRLRKQIV